MGFVPAPWELFSDDPAIFSRGVCEMLRREEKRQTVIMAIALAMFVLSMTIVILSLGGL